MPWRDEPVIPRSIQLFLVVLVAVMLAGCGFHLRGDVSLPFHSVFLSLPTSHPLYHEFQRSLEGSGAVLAATPAAADATLDIVSAPLADKEILSLSSGGKVREYLLQTHVLFRLYDTKGNEWVPTTDVATRRTYTYNDTEALAKAIEETRLVRDMQIDTVQQVMRRLQAAKRPPA